eukprot:jgi/Mesvir1/22843/Mv25123-RA.2
MTAASIRAILHSPGCALRKRYSISSPRMPDLVLTHYAEKQFRHLICVQTAMHGCHGVGYSAAREPSCSPSFGIKSVRSSDRETEAEKAGHSLAVARRRSCILTLFGVATASYDGAPNRSSLPDDNTPMQSNLPGARRRLPLRIDRDPDTYLSKGYAKEMLRAIAEIESGYRPHAYRWEEALGEPSVGLMQTLLSTARWLATDMGYVAFGVPTLEALMDPWISLYFGAAYLDWLSHYGGRPQSLEFMVRAYNGGPGGATSSATLAYWRKYQACIASFPKF